MDYIPENIYNKEISLEDLPSSTPMKDYYRGKTVFLTGSTGFLGQLYVQKLLSVDVKKLYLLIRPKKGKDPKERLNDIFSGPIFSKLSKSHPDYMDRIHVIEGDTTLPQLGISESDIKDMVENVQIIIHCAADVRFDEDLCKLILNNARATKYLLEIGKEMKNLEVFAYISTAYSNCIRTKIEEKFYDAPLDSDIVIELAERYVNDKDFQTIHKKIIEPWPNSYVYSKAIAEAVVRKFGQIIPICIIRPTVVISTFEDPIPGWCNNVYGLNGMIVATGFGFLRILHADESLKGDIVCADFVTNSTLATIWATHEQTKLNKLIIAQKDPEIYHVSTYQDRPVTWGQIRRIMGSTNEKHPRSKAMWKISINFISSPLMAKILSIYYHVIPAFIFQIILKMQGKNLNLLQMYRKVQLFQVALTYFMNIEFEFTNDNMKRVLAKMSPEDQEIFPSDVRRYNFEDYAYNYGYGLQLYLGFDMKDDMAILRRKLKILKFLHFFVLIFYYSIHMYLYYFLFKQFGFIDYVKDSFSNIYEVFTKI